MAAVQGFFQSILQFAIYHDRILFHRINEEWTNSVFDGFFPFVTDPHRSGFLIIFALAIVIWKKRINTIPILLGCLLTVALTDITAARVIKPIVHRPRPQAAESSVRLLVPPQASFGFPSNHAANMAAAAAFFSFTVPLVGVIGVFAALAVAYSRVYVGVHYPLDVFFGALLGIFWAIVVFKAYILFELFMNPIKNEAVKPNDWRKKKLHKKRKKYKASTKIVS